MLGDCVFASSPHDISRNNPGNARVCPGLQAGIWGSCHLESLDTRYDLSKIHMLSLDCVNCKAEIYMLKLKILINSFM